MTKTPFMDTYFRKRGMADTGNKRKFYDIDTAVKKIKVVMGSQGSSEETLDAATQKMTPSNGSSCSSSGTKNDRTCEFAMGFSLLLSNVRIFNKCIGAKICELKGEGLMVHLNDIFCDVSGVMKVDYKDIETTSLESNPFKFILKLTPECADNLKNFFKLEPWHPNNYSDDSRTNLQLLCDRTVTSKVVASFYKKLSTYLIEHRSQPVKKSPVINNRGSAEPVLVTCSDSSDVSIEMEENLNESIGLNDCILSDDKITGVEIEIEKTVKSQWDEIDVTTFYGKTSNERTETGKKKKKDDDGDIMVISKIIKKKCIKCGEDMDAAGLSGSVKRLKCLKCIPPRKKNKVNGDIDVVCVKEVSEKDGICRNLFDYPAPPTPGRITFTTIDLACLEPEEFFNDVCIDFYLKYFHNELQLPADRKRTHIFSSFFYSHLTSDSTRIKDASLRAKQRHERVQKWTRNVDIFSKDFIIVPINQNYHWFLAIICFPGLCIEQQNYSRCSLLDATPAIKKNTSLAQKQGETTTNSKKTKYNKATAKDNTTTTQDNVPKTKDNEKSTQKGASNITPGKSYALNVIASYESGDSEQDENIADDETNGGDERKSEKDEILESEDSKLNGDDADSESEVVKSEDTKTTDDVDSSDVIKCPLILVFDSLGGGKPRWDITSTLRQYLQAEWNVKKGNGRGEDIFSTIKIKGCVPRCPQQENYYDCGSYLLLYVQHFFLAPIKNFSPPVKGINKWFHNDEAKYFRKQLKDLALSLAKKESPSSTASSSLSSSVNQMSCDPSEFCELLDVSL